MSADQRIFRNALGCFGTGVCIITAETPTGPIGLTVNSFASVSLDPPLILWSLDRASDRMEAFHITDRFAVNVLRAGQHDIASQLAKKGAHAIPDGAFDHEPGGLPWIKGALAHFACKVEVRHDGGDHVIFVGRVEHFGHIEDGEPLLYYRGKFRALAEA